MTRIFTEGFELGDQANFTSFFNDAMLGATPSTQKRPNSGNYSVSLANFANGACMKSFSPLGELYYRQAIRFNLWQDYWPLAWAAPTPSSNTLGHLNIEGNKLCLYVGNSKVATGSLILLNGQDVWYLMEIHIKVDDSVGKIELKMDNITDIDYNGDTKPSTDTTIGRLYWGSYISMWLDDIAMNDTAGTVDNSWCGDGRIISLVPNGTGDLSEWVPSSGSVNYAMVDELPPSSTDYVSGSTTDIIDFYNITNWSGSITNPNIRRVWAIGEAADTVATGSKIALGIYPTGGSYVWSDDISLTTTYAMISGSIYTTNPATGLPWTTSDINSLQLGIRVRS